MFVFPEAFAPYIHAILTIFHRYSLYSAAAGFRLVQIRFKTNSLPSCNHGNHKQLTERQDLIIQ